MLILWITDNDKASRSLNRRENDECFPVILGMLMRNGILRYVRCSDDALGTWNRLIPRVVFDRHA